MKLKKTKVKTGAGIAAAAVVLAAAGVFGIRAAVATDTGGPVVITAPTLEKIVDLSELSTMTSVYNGIAEVCSEEDPEEVLYYVAYKAKVQAGIDLAAIDIDVDDETKTVTVALPQVRLNEVNVDIASLDYIFVNERANDATVSHEAYKACQADANAECQRQEQILTLARQNAENTITALIEPFIQQADAAYTVEFA